MAATPLTTLLRPPGPFSTFNREERNAVATLYAALLTPGNLQVFAELLNWRGLGDPSEAEIFVEWSFTRDLWKRHQGPEARRAAVLETLAPGNREYLATCSIAEFNAFFGASPKASAKQIQYPGRWSVAKLDEAVLDNEEFRRTCVYKWSFNVKPDLVVHGSAGDLLCIEAKWEGGGSSYPSAAEERQAFVRRQLKTATQFEVQQHLVGELLGFRGDFRYLVRQATTQTTGFDTVTWKEALGRMDVSRLPPFVRRWIAHL